MLRAFASGAVALTGVEAIADGVPAFRRPEARNAPTTLVMMATILGTAFFGISLLSARLDPTPTEHNTLSILGTAVFGMLYYILQFSTFAILILAQHRAPTSPACRRSSPATSSCPISSATGVTRVLQRDHRPRRARAGADRRLGGVTTALLLYAVGVFTGFTLSQAGMVVRHRRLREPGWKDATATT